MRAAGIETFGGEVQMLELAAPQSLAPDDVEIAVRAAGVGNWDEIVRVGGWDVGCQPPLGPNRYRAHVEGGEWEDEVHDRHVLAVAEHGNVSGDDKRGREAECECGPGDELEPVRRHLSGIRLC